MINKITDRIAYIKATDNPLSADIGIVQGDERIYLFDTGNGPAAKEELKEFLSGFPEKEVYCVISHFHGDHAGNFAEFNHTKIFVGNHTLKYVPVGEAVSSPLEFDDGVKIVIFPLPSSHAKGCLAMEVNNEYVFLGDATYPAEVNNEEVYNKGLLQEELEVLKELPVKSFLLSHKPRFIYPAKVVIRELESVYGRRLPNEQYIKA